MKKSGKLSNEPQGIARLSRRGCLFLIGTVILPVIVVFCLAPASRSGSIPLLRSVAISPASQQLAAIPAPAHTEPSPDTALPATEVWRAVHMRVTAYCACPRCCGRFADGLTACGYRIRPGDRFVAADKGLPFGMEIIVPGYNADRPVVVLDRGGLITGNRLDVYFDTHQQAKNWGVKYLDVLVKSG